MMKTLSILFFSIALFIGCTNDSVKPVNDQDVINRLNKFPSADIRGLESFVRDQNYFEKTIIICRLRKANLGSLVIRLDNNGSITEYRYNYWQGIKLKKKNVKKILNLFQRNDLHSVNVDSCGNYNFILNQKHNYAYDIVRDSSCLSEKFTKPYYKNCYRRKF